jgi:hypothetical protein
LERPIADEAYRRLRAHAQCPYGPYKGQWVFFGNEAGDVVEPHRPFPSRGSWQRVHHEGMTEHQGTGSRSCEFVRDAFMLIGIERHDDIRIPLMLSLVRMAARHDDRRGKHAAHNAQRARQILEAGDVEEGLNAAAAIGDDRLQRRSQGTVVPESFTHGSSEQRVRWFKRGIERGEPKACDTFGAQAL